VSDPRVQRQKNSWADMQKAANMELPDIATLSSKPSAPSSYTHSAAMDKAERGAYASELLNSQEAKNARKRHADILDQMDFADEDHKTALQRQLDTVEQNAPRGTFPIPGMQAPPVRKPAPAPQPDNGPGFQNQGGLSLAEMQNIDKASKSIGAHSGFPDIPHAQGEDSYSQPSPDDDDDKFQKTKSLVGAGGQ